MISEPKNHAMQQTAASKVIRLIPVALFATFLLALWVRIQFHTILGGTVSNFADWAMSEGLFGGISKFYLHWADEILKGTTYTPLQYPFGYPYLLAFFKLIGIAGEQKLRFVSLVLDATNVYAIYLLLRACLCLPVFAIVGSLLYATVPAWSASCTMLMPEALSAVFILWSCVLAIWCTSRGNSLAAFATGLLSGYGALCRPDLLFLAPLYAAWIFLRAKGKFRWRGGAALLAGFMIVVGSWGVHNRIHHGVWLFTSTSGGTGLWQGLGEIPNNYGYVISDAFAHQTAEKHGVNYLSIEGDRLFKKLYVEAVRKHPDHFVKVTLSRWENIVYAMPNYKPGIFYMLNQFWAAYGIWLLLAAILLNRGGWNGAFIVSLPLVYALLSIGMVHYEERYITYAYTTYLLATIVIINALYSLTFSMLRMKWLGGGKEDEHAAVPVNDTAPQSGNEIPAPRPWPSRVLQAAWFVGGGAVFIYLASYAVNDLKILKTVASHFTRAAVIKEDLRALHAKGQLSVVKHLQNLQFDQLSPNVVKNTVEGRLHLVTNESITDPQIRASVPVAGQSGFLVDIDVDVESGGNGGLMVTFWVDEIQVKSEYLLGNGNHKLVVAVPTTDAWKFQVLVSNYNFKNNPKGTVTEAVFKKFNILTVGQI